MKSLLATIILSASCISASAANLTLPIRNVVDGDTINSTLKLPCPLCAVSVRISGIDTPESTYQAKCPKEKALGLEAKAYTKKLIGENTEMTVRNIKWDKYGGRINGYVEVEGVDIGKALIEKGLARPYTGIGPKSNWCN